MGYYTHYEVDFITIPELIVTDRDKVFQDWVAYFSDKYGEPAYGRVPYPGISYWGDRTDGVKWYDWEDDMRAFSRRHPHLIFVVKGDGEESGDHWLAYVKNGKVQVADITWAFEPYNEAKLS